MMNILGTENKKTRIIINVSVILATLLLIYTVVNFQAIWCGTAVAVIPTRISPPNPVYAKKKFPSSLTNSELDETSETESSLKDSTVGTNNSSITDVSESEDFLLKPPSQDWVQRQVMKSLEIRGLVYSPTNQWDTCGSRSYFYPKINTIFTGVPKTGCSNWIEALLRAEGDLTKEIDPTKVMVVHGGLSGRHRMGANGKIAAEYNNTAFNKAFSFAVVRNPWTRMVSGFRDKVSSEITQGGSFRGLGKGIVRTMRGITDPDLLEDLYPTFPEFARWLVMRQTNGRVDGHFAPQWRTLCIPRVKYDYIIPLEYSGPLSKEVWGKIDASNISLLGSYDKSSDPRHQKSALLAKEWFSEIEQETIDQLYSIYRADFALVNYRNFTDPDFPLPLRDEQDTRQI